MLDTTLHDFDTNAVSWLALNVTFKHLRNVGSSILMLPFRGLGNFVPSIDAPVDSDI